MMFHIINFGLLLVAVHFHGASALDLKPHSAADSHQLENDGGAVSDLINHSLLQNSDAVHRLLVESACPVCDDGRALSMDDSRGSIIGNDEVSVDTLISVLTQAADQFTRIGQRLQTSYSTFTADTTDLVIAIYDLLTGIVLAITNLLLAIVSFIADSLSAVVLLISGIIISILNLIENVKLSIIEIIVNFLNGLTGGRRNLKEDESISSLQRMLASSAFGGIFSNVIAMLRDQDDDSGLIDILRNSADDMAAVEEQFNTFVEVSSDVSTNSNESVISSDTINEILSLIVEIINEIVALIINIISSILFLIVGVINAIANLIIGIIEEIISLIVSILNAILGILTIQGIEANDVTTASALSLISVMSVVLRSPLTKIAWCMLRVSDCGMSNEELECQVEALSCNSKALEGATA